MKCGYASGSGQQRRDVRSTRCGTPYPLPSVIAQQPRVRLCVSAALIKELGDVLTRPSAAKRFALIGRTAREVLADYVEVIEPVEPVSLPRVVVGDLDDDQVIAVAVAAHADLIVSGDRKQLLPLRSHQGVEIIDAAEALRRIAGS